MQDDKRDTGIPTRAIHEAYLQLQDSHRELRRARDNATRDSDRAHAMFQDAVLTFYELIRPHLKRKSSLSRFWVGELPKYPDRWWTSVDEARRYCSRAGTAVWSLQKHVQTAASSPNVNGESPVATDGGECEVPDDVREQLEADPVLTVGDWLEANGGDADGE